ncbi:MULTISPECIES: DUF2637 domain-containing protein [Streptomyces]|uniref:DUF2637 domain-containing protein n=2 Tax=Streptomyces TaxID=1883 RepID=A0A3M8F1G9_9ACTN|nr:MULTISPECIES: DUF2637 domain-containing protein [Streptomyces]KNE81634.1 hypothetical protein ADZ36_15690 [Streptomyces fradiae]OFA49598.1 hypothetical protein BEN35_17355 [Streptomyces fradiae]PQM21505.1 DUF2637 domain-containing protein [Streptomyces xinghaiensis]RKM94435.1 DUF2637 domain-containing protein [Streptomyces xinghaiensis]RNC72035.1 DUF2637 domain-containing protein [Streptomyces xinghaiensis]
MTVNLTKGSAAGVPPLSKPERVLLGTVAVAAGAVGILGLASSFDAVSAAAARWGFGAPWMLPVGIDVAIPVFTAANLLLIRVNMPLAWVRFVPWALTLVTCWLNIAAGHSLSAKLAHGTMPLLWVVLSEIAAHVYASRIGAVTGRRMEKIRRSRWLLAFPSTFALWRRMTLWEITSYSDALARERQRQLDRAELRERYGRRWRKHTPHRTRVLLKLGELAPAAKTETAPPPVPPGNGDQEQPEPKPERPARRPRNTTGKAKPKGKSVRSADELLAEARTVTAAWADEDLTAEAIRKTVRTSQANARTLRDALKAERAEAARFRREAEAGAEAA